MLILASWTSLAEQDLFAQTAAGRSWFRVEAEHLTALKNLNRHPERVVAPWFQTGTFFDAQDLVQVKYEMLRHVSQDGASKADSAALFGLSRPAFYQAEAALDREGLAGPLPGRRGPKGAHKLTAQIMSFIERRQVQDPQIHAQALAREIKAQLKLSVHPRSIERALARKKTPDTSAAMSVPPAALLTYEQMHAGVTNGQPYPEGLTAIVYHGMLHGLAVRPHRGRLQLRVIAALGLRARRRVVQSGALAPHRQQGVAVTITGGACLLSSIAR